MLTDCAQQIGVELLIDKELEHFGGSIVAGRVVGGARKALVAGVVENLVEIVPVSQFPELGEPAGGYRPQLTVGGKSEKPNALPQLAVLVTGTHHECILEVVLLQRGWDHIELMIGIQHESCPVSAAGFGRKLQSTGNLGTVEEDCRCQSCSCPVVDSVCETLAYVRRGMSWYPLDLDTLLLETGQEPSQRMELRVGGNQLGALPDGQRRKQTDEQFEGIGSQRIETAGIVEKAAVAGPNPIGFDRSSLPFVIDEISGIVPGTLLAVESSVRPGLMRMPGKQEALSHSKAAVVAGERVGVATQVLKGERHGFRIHYGFPRDQ